MNNEIQTELMTSMAAAVPLNRLFRQVEIAIDEYKKNPTEVAEDYIVFTMHIALMGRIIQKGHRTSEELKQDLMNQDPINNLFNIKNN
jgi:hypothetical protein